MPSLAMRTRKPASSRIFLSRLSIGSSSSTTRIICPALAIGSTEIDFHSSGGRSRGLRKTRCRLNQRTADLPRAREELLLYSLEPRHAASSAQCRVILHVEAEMDDVPVGYEVILAFEPELAGVPALGLGAVDRKSTRLNSSH